MNSLMRDIRHGSRILRGNPGFAVVAVLTLALGIGANSAIFSVVDSVLLKPLPYDEPDRLVELWETNPIKGWTDAPVASANLLDWQNQNDVFEGIGASFSGGMSNFSMMSADNPERHQGLGITPNLFPVLRARPLMGRVFAPDEQEEGKRNVVILSYGLWQRTFGGDPGIIGKTVTINDVGKTVVGVMPKGFQFPDANCELWVPVGIGVAQMATIRRPHFLRAIARLKPGVSIDQARSEMSTIADRLEQQYPETNVKMGVGLGTLQNWIVGDVKLPLLVFLAAVGFVLLIACANVANLMLAQGAARGREIAMRMALGAGRGRLVRQFLTESMLLALIGGAAGLFLAWWCLELLLKLSPGNIPRLSEVTLDARAVAFTVGLTFLTTLLFGLLPAVESTRMNLTSSIRDSGRAVAGGARGRVVQKSLAVAEVALALVLVTAGGLMMKSFFKLTSTSPGFDADKLLTFQLFLRGDRYKKDEQQVDFYNRLEAGIKSLPGVTSVGATSTLPTEGYSFTSDFTIEGRPPGEYGKEVRHEIVTPDYFRTVGLPLEKGRFFSVADDARQTAPAVVVINHTLQQEYFRDEDPVGKRLKSSKPEVKDDWLTIVGVVGDEKQEGLGVRTRAQIYHAMAQNAQSDMAVVVRSAGDPTTLAGGIREQIRELDSSLPPFNVKTMRDVMYGSLARDRFNAVLLLLFGGIALTLAAIGVYGVISYGVTQRIQEIGVRMALGAETRDVLALIVGQGLKLALAGVAVGAVGAFAATRLMAELLFGVSATDPLTFVATALLLTSVALLACYIPARRAAGVDPIEAIRFE
jgi:predicted permease